MSRDNRYSVVSMDASPVAQEVRGAAKFQFESAREHHDGKNIDEAEIFFNQTTPVGENRKQTYFDKT